ncbi:MAG: hypothetical protein HYY84_12225 [Deltaproteobacteria bacterium]|nr:hypothetical protein [Deltaproteobacteria bacterium]
MRVEIVRIGLLFVMVAPLACQVDERVDPQRSRRDRPEAAAVRQVAMGLGAESWIKSINLEFDVVGRSGTGAYSIDNAPWDQLLDLDIGGAGATDLDGVGLNITSVKLLDGTPGGTPLLYTIASWLDPSIAPVFRRLSIEVPADPAYDEYNPQTLVVQVTWIFADQSGTPLRGFYDLGTSSYTYTWPYYCGNLFPCTMSPRFGSLYSMTLRNVPAGQTAIYPEGVVLGDPPSYMLAFAIGAYTTEPLGTTVPGGTTVNVYYLPGGKDDAIKGTKYLKNAFQYFENSLGTYRFGPTAGTVQVAHSAGGMEHHPFWHLSSIYLPSPEMNVHESAHGWYGNGVRIQCQEDFVLSEGTVSYLTAVALEAVGDASDPWVSKIWDRYKTRLDNVMSSGVAKIAWPGGGTTCDQYDVGANFTDIPYMKGAFFFRALAKRVGTPALISALSSFYWARVGTAAGMQDLLDHIKAATLYDPTTCANDWLKSISVPAYDTCP